jgi:hypothetical protein
MVLILSDWNHLIEMLMISEDKEVVRAEAE